MANASHFTRKVTGYTHQDNLQTGGRRHFAQLECGHEVHIPRIHVDQVSEVVCPECRDYVDYGTDERAGDGK